MTGKKSTTKGVKCKAWTKNEMRQAAQAIEASQHYLEGIVGGKNIPSFHFPVIKIHLPHLKAAAQAFRSAAEVKEP